jgi:hypothetical protein
MSLSSLLSLEEKRELIVNQAMIICISCKKLNEEELSERFGSKERFGNKESKTMSASGLNHFKIQIKLDQSSEFLRTRSIIQALNMLNDSMNLMKTKIYYNMSEYVTISSIINDYKEGVKTKELKRGISI